MATPPQQARSIATEKKMLDAAEELLRGGDARQVTVENVTKLSGTRVSSFYARFGSVEGLFEAMEDRYRAAVYKATLLRALEKSIEQKDLKSSLHQAILVTLEMGHQERRVISYFVARPSVDQTARVELRTFVVGLMHKILLHHRGEIPRNDLQRASENVVRMILAIWTQIVLEEPSEFFGRKTSLSSVIDATTEMSYHYLTHE